MKFFKKNNLSGKRGILLKNTLMLYILQFSTFALGLLVAPYQTRILGSEIYGGVLDASVSIILYFQLIIDFGFLLSATEEVSRERDNPERLQQILTAVTVNKIGLAFASFFALIGLCQVIPAWRTKQTILILTFIATFFNSLMPDFLYRGLEKMSAITYRTVAIRIFFTAALFVFLKRPEDVWVVPTLNIVGNGVALVFAYLHVYRSLHIRFCKVSAGMMVQEFKSSAFFFLSRFATTAYTALNTVILDIITQSGAATGYYASANKLITSGKNGLTPIADSLYPYMAKHKDFKLVKKVLLISEPLIFVFCSVVFIFAKPFCAWFFGEEFAQAGTVLRAMLPIGVVTLPTYILGFPTMTAMGISKHANYSTIFGSVFHCVLLAVLYFTGHMNMVTLAISVSATETVILLYRILVIWKNRRLMTAAKEEL